MFKHILYAITSLALLTGATAQAQDKPILNASYDVAREVFAAINPKFQAQWKAQTGKELQIDQSFAGTSRQAQDIIQGKKVDTVTFNQVTDIDFLAQRGLVKKDWRAAFPNNSSPYYSTIAFLVRKGNPKHIKGWDDLVRDDVKLVFPNPKTSGNARYTYLGAWLFANEKFAGDQTKIKQFVGKFLHNVVNFATGGRGATVAFAQNGQGDVLLTFESEVLNIASSDEFKAGAYEVVVPSVSVLEELDAEQEEAAATLGAHKWQVFCRITVPTLMPALITGASQAFIRSLGEFGAVIMIAGNIPFKTEVTSLMIFVRLQEFNYAAAAAIASVVLVASLLLLFLLQLLQVHLFQRVAR